MSKEDTTEPFRDFPNYYGWFFSEKVIQWKKRNQQAIEQAFKDQQLLSDFPMPPMIFLTNSVSEFPKELKDWYLSDFSSWLERVRSRSEVGKSDQAK